MIGILTKKGLSKNNSVLLSTLPLGNPVYLGHQTKGGKYYGF